MQQVLYKIAYFEGFTKTLLQLLQLLQSQYIGIKMGSTMESWQSVAVINHYNSNMRNRQESRAQKCLALFHLYRQERVACGNYETMPEVQEVHP